MRRGVFVRPRPGAAQTPLRLPGIVGPATTHGMVLYRELGVVLGDGLEADPILAAAFLLTVWPRELVSNRYCAVNPSGQSNSANRSISTSSAITATPHQL